MSENDASDSASVGSEDADAPEDGERTAARGESSPVAPDGDEASSGVVGRDAAFETVDERSGGIDADEIDPAELTVPLQSLHPRIRYLWVFKAAISAAVLGILVGVLDVVTLGVGAALPLGVTTALFVLGTIHALLRYRVWKYEVREDALYLERGVLTRVRTVVPFVRIQHVDTSRGPIERATGLATSIVYTAGSRGADVAIPGLTADRAEDMQRRLKQLAIAAEDDTAV